MRRSAPNEFKVVSNPPLSIPPEFSIRPPAPENTYKEVVNSKTNEAKKVLFEKASADYTVENKTDGEETFSSMFNAHGANPEIKSLLHKEFLEAAKQEEEKSLIEKNLLSKIPYFSKDKKEEASSIVDAKLEQDRIVETKRLGEKVTGEDTPSVESTKKESSGIFNKIFGL
jgi:thioredoxin-like negative regulator of GroEL